MGFFSERLEEVRKTCLGVNVHSIHQSTGDQISLPIEDRLIDLGISYDEVIYFTPSGGEAHNISHEQHDAAGVTSFFIKDGVAHSVIFINGEIGKLTNTEGSEYEDLLKYIFLIHEIGHADDFSKQINFKHVTREVNLISSEAYADVFALRHLKSSAGQGFKLARGAYCKNMLANRVKSEFYRRVFDEVTRKFLESKIREWARA